MTYETNSQFLKMFGYASLNDLPELPKYKLDENQQIVIEDLIEKDTPEEAPNPEREQDKDDNKDNEE